MSNTLPTMAEPIAHDLLATRRAPCHKGGVNLFVHTFFEFPPFKLALA